MTHFRILVVLAAAVFAILATWSLAFAQPRGDAGAGETLHAKDCVACHIRRVGGDGAGMYTRSGRRVTTPEKLKAQIAVCNAELGTNYFPDEEEHIAAYLNLRYYKFKD